MGKVIEIVTTRRYNATQTAGERPVVWFPRPKRLGALIRAARERQGMSLFDLALELDRDPSALARIERGQRSVEWETICQIGMVLGDPDILDAAEQALREHLGFGPEAA